MCGIAGIYDLSGRFREGLEERCRAMQQNLAHRGPDGEGTYRSADQTLALAHRRLSIIDLSAAGAQPIPNEDSSVWLVFNGEIYNFQPLRKQLLSRGHRFRSNADTEVIVHLYEDEGLEGMLSKLRGMFAFALWDEKKKALFLCRDRFGIKPIYYYCDGKTLAFASEVQALRRSGVVPEQTEEAAWEAFLQFGSVPAPLTTIKGVYSLPAGHSLLCHQSQGWLALTIRKYYDLPTQQSALSNQQSATVDEIAAKVRALLGEAVSLHLISDVEVGVFLSGGVDSSTLVALATLPKVSPSQLRTLFVFFEDQDGADEEGACARLVARRFQTRHAELTVSAHDFYVHLPAIFSCMDQPTVDGLNTYFVSKAAKEANLKVVLSGLGADELFLGYSHFLTLHRMRGGISLLERCPQPLRKAVLRGAAALLESAGGAKFRRLRGLEEDVRGGLYPLVRGLFAPSEVEVLLEGRTRSDGWRTTDDELPDKNDDIVKQVAFWEMKRYLQNQLLKDTDFMSMAHSIEVRVPFLDHCLVEAVYPLPLHIKFWGEQTKGLLLRSMGSLLPKEVRQRKKRAFTVPLDAWMRRKLKTFHDLVSSGPFRQREVERLLNAFRRGRVHWSKVWALVVASQHLTR